MLISIEELRKIAETDESDYALSVRLSAIEAKIRAYTNNHFMVKGTTVTVAIKGDTVICNPGIFRPGQTVELMHTKASDGVHTVICRTDDGFRLSGDLLDGDTGTMTLVRYPQDVVMGAVAMLQYDKSIEGLENVASESISRHSVTYKDLNSATSLMGYPMHVISFLKPYRRARV